MAKRIEVPPAPTVYCAKDGKEVPCWYCLGSLTQGREMCPYLVKATIHGGESAEVECNREGLVRHLIDTFGEFKKVVRMTTGEAFKVPTRDIIEKGIREQDLDQYPIWENNKSGG